jgi:hypothetical protein
MHPSFYIFLLIIRGNIKPGCLRLWLNNATKAQSGFLYESSQHAFLNISPLDKMIPANQNEGRLSNSKLKYILFKYF